MNENTASGKTNKGKRTREAIQKAARVLFYEKGYNRASIQEIATMADAKLGTVTYYYKKKNDLVGEIYNAFFMDLYDYVSDAFSEDSLFEKYATTMILLFDTILSDEKNERFFFEIVEKGVHRRERLSLIKTFNRSCLDYFNKPYTEDELNAFTVANYGSQSKLFAEYYEGHLQLTPREMVYHLVRNSFRLYAIDRDTLENTLKGGFRFLEETGDTGIRFLV